MTTIRLRGESLEDKLDNLTKIVDKLRGSLAEQKVPIVPNILPVSCNIEDPQTGDVIVKYFFPLAGSIKKVCSYVEGFKSITLNILAKSRDGVHGQLVTIGEEWREKDLALDIAAGTVLTIKIDSMVPKGEVPKELFFSVVYQVNSSRQLTEYIPRSQLEA